MRTGNNVKAPVRDGRVVQSNPRAHKGTIARWYVNLVLVPGLALKLRRLHKQHRLHALDPPVPIGQMCGCDRAENRADSRVMNVPLNHRTDEMRLMDAEDTSQN